METLAEKNRDQKETTLAFKPVGPHIQIDSISIEISSGEMNETLEECKHFSIRGFVSEVRKKDSSLCSPFLSDGDVNNSNVPPFELPPLEFRKFRWWRCSGCLQDCNSSQGIETSKEIAIGKSMPSQNSGKQRCHHEYGCSKGLSKLFARADANGSPTSSQRSAKGKQVQEGGYLHDISKDIVRDPLCCCSNSQGKLLQKSAKGKHLLPDVYSQGPSKENNVVPFSPFPNSRGASFLKSVNEAVMVPFNGINFEKATSSRNSVKEQNLQKGSSSRGMPKLVMGPPVGFSTSPKSSKEQNLQKSGYSHGMSKEFAMPPPGGFSNSRQPSLKSGKGSHLQHNTSSRGAPSKDSSMLPLTGYPSGKNTSVKLSKQQNIQNPKPNARIWQKGETSTAVTLSKKRNYAKRSVQQPESTGDEHEIYKGGENCAIDSNTETLQHGAAKKDDLLMPERFTADKAPLQLHRNEEDKSVEQVSNFSTAGRTLDSAGPSLLQCDRFVKDVSNGDSYLHEDGADKNSIPVRPSSNRLFKKPSFDDGLEAGRNNLYEEEEEEDYRGVRLKRVPKIRLLSDVIAKYPTNIPEQLDNSKASPGASNDISPGRGVSSRFGEQSSKRKVSPIASHDTSAERGVSDKAGEQSSKAKASPVGSHDTPTGRLTFVAVSWKKRKRNPLDDEEHLADLLNGGSKRNSIRFAEPENKVVHTSQYRPGIDVSGETIFIADAKKQNKHIPDRTEVEKKFKKARVQNVGSSSVLPLPIPESRDNCEADISKPVYGGFVTNGVMDKSLKNIFSAEKVGRVHGYRKKISSPTNGEDCQTATKLLQFSLDNAPDDSTSDCIIIGSGLIRRNDVVENFENSSTPLSSVAEHQTSVLTGKESCIPQLQAGVTLLERKVGEQKGNTAEAKGRVKDIDINSIPVDDKAPGQGSTDDIPMDIVELLAKHQHERRCDATREKLSLLNSAAQKSFPSMLKPQASYANNGFGKQFEVMGHGKQILSDHFETRRKSVLVGYPKDDHFCARFTGYTQTQGHVPGGAQYSSSMGSTAKSWNGNTVPFRPPSRGILQHMPSYNRYQGGLSPAPPLNTQIWPPMMSSRVPPLGGLANQGMHSQGSDMLHKGKVNEGAVSFNFERVAIGNPTSSTPQPWNSRISDYTAGGRQKTADFHPPKMMRPVDLSSNETIPAMQLLNLVQVAGSRSSTPPVNGNTEFLKKLPFDHSDNKYKQYAPGPHFEPYKSTGSISRHPLYDNEGRASFIDKPCQCSSALPTAHMFAASAFQNEQMIGKSSGLKNPIAFTSHDQRTMCGSSYNPLVGDLCPDKPSTQIYRTDKKRKSIAAGKSAVAGHVLPVSGMNILQPVAVPLNRGEFCVVNRNPAELLDWKEVRNFMIDPEDLRRGKAVLSSRLVPNAKRPQTILKGKGRERLHKS